MFVVPWTVFPFEVLVCLGSSREDVLERIQLTVPDITPEEISRIRMNGTGRALMLSGGQTLLWLRSVPLPGSGVLAHEIVHATYYALDRMNIAITEGTEELVAYMVEYLTNAITSHLRDAAPVPSA